MSEISWLRERSAGIRASLDDTELSDAIDTVLDHLSSVEASRCLALAEIGELKKARDDHYKSMSYYYAELVAVAEVLGREHDGNEVPIGGLAQAIECRIAAAEDGEN